MSELLKRAQPMRKAKYLCMEGADKLVCHPNAYHEIRAHRVTTAEWILRNLGQAQLGFGSQSWYDVGPQDEW